MRQPRISVLQEIANKEACGLMGCCDCRSEGHPPSFKICSSQGKSGMSGLERTSRERVLAGPRIYPGDGGEGRGGQLVVFVRQYSID